MRLRALSALLPLLSCLINVAFAEDASTATKGAAAAVLLNDATCQAGAEAAAAAAAEPSEESPSFLQQIVLDEYDPQPDYAALAAQVRTIYDVAAATARSSTANDSTETIATAETLSLSPKLDSALVRPPQLPSNNNHSTAATRRRRTLSVNSLTRILSIQMETNENDNDNVSVTPTVTVQARCTFDALVRATLKYGYIPAVVPEFATITVGGAIVGAALESSSFWHGQVSDTVLHALVLLGNGTIAKVTSRDELYHALPGSYGSLGIVLQATLRLQRIEAPASSSSSVTSLTSPSWPQRGGRNHTTVVTVVAVRTKVYRDTAAGMAELVRWANRHGDNAPDDDDDDDDDLDFLDAIQFPSGPVVIVLGQFATVPEQDIVLTRPWQDHGSLWWYERIQDRLVNTNEELDSVWYVPVHDYLFRYERGAFWMARPMKFSWRAILANPLLVGPFLASWRVLRPLLGRFFTATNLYRLFHAVDVTAAAETFILQDSYMPGPDNATALVEYIRTNIPVTVPLWLCPVKRPLSLQPLSPSGQRQRRLSDEDASPEKNDDSILVNVALWGRVSNHGGIQYTAALEHAMLELGGRKMLYSVSPASTMTAHDLYHHHVDGEAYRRLRRTYHAEGVWPALHEKLRIPITQLDKATGTARPRKVLHYWISRLVL
jgi:Delta24-sterol reductase